MRWGGTLLVTLVLGSLVACSSGSSGSGPDVAPGDGSVAAAEGGQRLSRAAADGLEKALQAAPGDLAIREQLVGYYFMASALGSSNQGTVADPNAATVARDRHLVWLIQHAPAVQLLGTSPMGMVQPRPDTAGYQAARDAWSNQVGEQAAAAVKGNAGLFFAQSDDPRADGLLAAAESGDPRSATWPDALGELYARRARTSTPGSQAAQQAAAAAVRELDRAWTISGSSSRDPRLSKLAKLAVVAGLDDRAARYANLLLGTFKVEAGQSKLAVGGPIHDGNMVLGQVALHRGDRAGAQQSLLKAGATPGSPLLNQFGPNFSLARDLLGVGSRDVVLKYCDEVSKFWGDPKLGTWRSAIAAGQTPDFGDNLWN